MKSSRTIRRLGSLNRRFARPCFSQGEEIVQPARQASSSTVPGIIETLSAGFEHLNRVLWVTVIPIAVDLLLWLGPQVTAEPVIARLARWYEGIARSYTAMVGESVDAATVDQARQAITELEAKAGHFDLLSLLVVNIASVPSILPSASPLAPTIQVGTVEALVGIIVGAQLLGILIGCLYLGIMGQQIRDGRVELPVLGRKVLGYWLNIVGFLLLVIGVSVGISIPVGLAMGVAQLVMPGAGAVLLQVVSAAAEIGAILLLIYLFFLVDAIVLSEVGPVRAALNSARVVASNFWPTLGFIALIYVITLGMQVIWTALSGTLLGTAVAIVGNAYIASGLTAASLLYYQTRAARLALANGVPERSDRP